MTKIVRMSCPRKEIERQVKEGKLDWTTILPVFDGSNNHGELSSKIEMKCSKRIRRLNRMGREKSKNTKSITNAFNQKWLNEQKNKEDK